MADPVKAGVIEGFHPFDVIRWHQLMRSLAGIDYYQQVIDNWAVNFDVQNQEFDVLLFYNMNMKISGSPFRDQIGAALEKLGESDQGLFFLHHALLAYPDSPEWGAAAGIEDRSFDFHIGQQLQVEVQNGSHPITEGLDAWEMTDETYTMANPGNDADVLFTTEHEKSMKVLGWAHQYRNARVFCFQPGHDNLAWSHPSFRRVVQRGLLWCAKRI
jgi:uncharacterized protein